MARITTNIKIALLLFGSSLTTLLIFAAAIYYFLDKYSYADFYKRLETRATIAARYNLESGTQSAEAARILRTQYLERLSQEREHLFRATSETELESIAMREKISGSFLRTIWREGRATHKEGNTFYAGIRHDRGAERYIVIISADNYFASHHLSFLRTILFGSIVFVALITAGLSLYFSRRIFSPIKDITGKVREISTDNIHLRLEQAEGNDEISELSSTFNDLLDRIETAFETQKNFISNASHELGTPLTAIIGEADVALLKPRTADEYRDVLKSILEQADRLDQITKSLLFLAQAGYRGKVASFERLRIDELVWQAKETIDHIDPQNDIQIDSSFFPEDPMKLKVQGNAQLLHLAVANILGNACKYSHNKPVLVSIAASDGHVVIVVKDDGVGIPDAEQQFIYDPFFRASNTTYFDGYGIGLPLARNIVRMHDGQLDVVSVVNVGTTVRIRLPLG